MPSTPVELSAYARSQREKSSVTCWKVAEGDVVVE
jgi:hypothetical protein